MKKADEEKIRTFVAIELPQEIHDNIKKLRDSFKSSMPDARWTKYGNVHLTLKFLGDVAVSRIDQISDAIKGIAEGFSAFNLNLSGLGAFPNSRKPRIIWVGIEKGADEVVEIAKQVESSMEKFGFPSEKRAFRPHLTIGRIRQLKHPAVMQEALDQAKVGEIGEFTVEKISFIKSQLDTAGSIYTTLAEAFLKGSEQEEV